MYRSGREAFSDVRKRSGGPPVCQTVVEKLSPDVREWSGVVGRPTRTSGSGREAHPDIWEWLGGLPDFREWTRGHP